MLGPTSHSYFSQRLRLHYVDWGNPDAPPMILIHGGRDHCRNWDWVAEAFRDEYHIIARGTHLTLKINGHTTAEVIDNETAHLDRQGKLALQIHSGPPMKVQFKDIRIRMLD